jgi:hypothetical protein
VLVERFGEKKKAEERADRGKGPPRGPRPPKRQGRAGRRDRSSGPRPSRPKDR